MTITAKQPAKKRTAKGTAKGTGGRPRKDVDFEKIDALCQYHCTAQEIVAHLQIFDRLVSYATVERRIKEKFKITFAEYVKQKHMAHAKPRLRKLQWEAAKTGNVTMLIWLGKQYLGQTDKQEMQVQQAPSIEFVDASRPD